MAIVTKERELDYAELAERCRTRVAALAERGLLDATRPLGLLVRPTLASLEMLLACLAHGVPVLVLAARAAFGTRSARPPRPCLGAARPGNRLHRERGSRSAPAARTRTRTDARDRAELGLDRSAETGRAEPRRILGFGREQRRQPAARAG